MTMDDLCPGINYEVYCVSKYAGLLSCYNTSKSSIGMHTYKYVHMHIRMVTCIHVMKSKLYIHVCI